MTVHVDLTVQIIWPTLNNNLPDIVVTPKLIYKILAMANDSDDWDADSIQAKLQALQLSSKPEQSLAHEWDGDAINSRLEALLQATVQHHCTWSDHGRPPLDVNPNLNQEELLSYTGSEPPDVALSQVSLREQGPPLPSPPSTFLETSLSPPSRSSPLPIDDSYQPTPVSPLSNDNRELPEVNMSSMGEFNSINESIQASDLRQNIQKHIYWILFFGHGLFVNWTPSSLSIGLGAC